MFHVLVRSFRFVDVLLQLQRCFSSFLVQVLRRIIRNLLERRRTRVMLLLTRPSNDPRDAPHLSFYRSNFSMEGSIHTYAELPDGLRNFSFSIIDRSASDICCFGADIALSWICISITPEYSSCQHHSFHASRCICHHTYNLAMC